ncbi:MAG: peptidase M48 [Gammaproteobacteria bacterium]|nr:peptidase M48 [Gammaproteobacteria bacterium]|tara:strand:- start:6711 stop:8165 length:1455 start_codon:yes stop_codon:yes gene_type:complete
MVSFKNSFLKLNRYILLLSLLASFSLNTQETLPELGDTSSSAISLDSEYRLGRLYVAQLRRSLPDLQDAIVQDYVEHLIYRVSEYSQLEDRRLELVMIKDKNINAFAAPGGIIGINAGLIYHSENEGQFVSVVAHELAHLSQRHFARNLQRQKDRSLSNALILLASVAIAASSRPDAIMAGQQILVQQALSYSRSNEQEADRIGFLTMISAGYDPESMPQMFEKLQSLSRLSGASELEFLRSHPLTKKRISDSRIRAREIEGSNYKNSLSFELIKQRVSTNFFKTSRQAVVQLRQETRKAKSTREKIIARYGLALALSRDNKYNQALEEAREALKLQKSNLILQSALLEIHLNAGNGLEAVAVGKNLLEMNPLNYPISMMYARALIDQKKYDQAEEVLKKLLFKRKEDPQVWYWLAEVQGLARKIISLHQSRAEYFYLTGSYDRAIEHLRYAMELVGNNFQLNEILQTKIENIFATKEELKEFT